MSKADWSTRLQGRNELLECYIGLTKYTSERAGLDLAVHRHDTTFGTTPHDDVATGLAKLLKAETLQRPHDSRTGNMRQFRHARER